MVKLIEWSLKDYMKKIYEEVLARVNTPCYVFDIKELKRRISYLQDSLPSKIDLCFDL